MSHDAGDAFLTKADNVGECHHVKNLFLKLNPFWQKYSETFWSNASIFTSKYLLSS